jgi:putative transposase
MHCTHRYAAYPSQQVAERLERHIDVHRQAYNYTRYEYTHVDADNIGSAYKHHESLADWKDRSRRLTKFT